VVDGFDQICEFWIGWNFGAQGKSSDQSKHFALQCQKVLVVLVLENGTALVCRRESSDV